MTASTSSQKPPAKAASKPREAARSQAARTSTNPAGDTVLQEEAAGQEDPEEETVFTEAPLDNEGNGAETPQRKNLASPK